MSNYFQMLRYSEVQDQCLDKLLNVREKAHLLGTERLVMCLNTKHWLKLGAEGNGIQVSRACTDNKFEHSESVQSPIMLQMCDKGSLNKTTR